MLDLLITNGFVYIGDKFYPQNIGIKEGRIAYLGLDKPEAKEIYDINNKKVIPGLIDPHVHFELNCGTITSVDDFYYGSKSAAYGGVTTIIDFLDPTRNAAELEKSFYERKKLAEKCNVDYHFHACIREPDGDLKEYVLKMKELGMNTIKLFTTYSETHRRTYDKDIKKLLRLSKRYHFLVLAHIENDEMINRDENLTYKDLAEARSSEAETSEALKLCKYAAQTGGNLYMVHCSSGRTLDEIVKKYKSHLGKNIFIESCPQYFFFNKDILQTEQGYLYTFAPPLRSEEERKLLISNFKYLSAIGTDHCSFNFEDKQCHTKLKGMPLGVGGIESSYVLMNEMFGDEVIAKMSTNIAKIEDFSLKTGIKIGNYADLVVVSYAPNSIGKPHGRANYSIYENMKVSLKVESTLVRGRFVLKDGEFIEGKGELIDADKQVIL